MISVTTCYCNTVAQGNKCDVDSDCRNKEIPQVCTM